MTKLRSFFTKYKKECIALFIFVICLSIFSISHAFAAVEPVRSIVIQSENTDFASGEEGSWQVTKSGYWTNYGEAEVSLDVDTSLMTNNSYTDIIFVLDISGSMSGDKLDRVKRDSKELISSLLSNKNNKAALITFDTSSQIVSDLTNDEELLLNEIDNLEVTGSTNYYQALVNVDNILKDYQKENNKEVIVLFLTDGYPNVDTPNQITQYNYLKSMYPYITVNGIQYEMGEAILNPIKEISDNQFIADMETLNNVLFDASVNPIPYETYQIIDYIDNDNFTLESKKDIRVSQGSVELTEEEGRQKITWTLDNLASGREANLTMKLKLKEELIGQGGIYPTNETTEVISKIDTKEEDVTTTNTPILSDNYKVIYDGNAPEGCNVSNIPDTYNYSVFSTIEISDEVPSCEGYQFMGWKIETKNVTRVGKDYFIMPESDVIIKAEWSKIGITKSMNGTVNNMGDPIMKRYYSNTNTDYHSSTYKSKVTSIVTKDNLEIPNTAIETWDVSEAGDGSVIAYIEDDERGTGTYKVTIGAQGNIIANPNSSYLFYGSNSNRFSSLETIDLTYLDTSQVTDMSCMFMTDGAIVNSPILKVLDLSNFDTGQVTDMRGMFSGQRSLEEIKISTSFDTSNVIDMGMMFQYCNNLLSINLANFNTYQVTSMSYMFQQCSSLTSLDLSNFDTSQVTFMSYMFSQCESLESTDLSSFDTSQVKNMRSMFYDCKSLTNLDVSNFDTSKVIDMSYMFYDCKSLTSLDLSNFDTSQVTNMGGMFNRCSSLTNLDVNNFNTSKVTDMNSMFNRCSSLTNLDVNNFNTSKVTDMSAMFLYCENLGSLFINKWDTSNAVEMQAMFNGCKNLSYLNISNFNTEKVTDMGAMFRDCSSLINLDIGNFKTPNLKEIYDYSYSGGGGSGGMFQNCSSLTDLDISNFDTSGVSDMSSMFYGCSSLLSLDLSSFDTSQVTNMNEMFRDCSSLTNLDLSNFDTSMVTKMIRMFAYCSNLTNLDMRNATFNATSYSYMFGSITNGITITVKDATAQSWIEARLSEVNRTGTVTIASV